MRQRCLFFFPTQLASLCQDERTLEGLRILDLATFVNKEEELEDYAERENQKAGGRLAKTPRVQRSSAFTPVAIPRRKAHSPRNRQRSGTLDDMSGPPALADKKKEGDVKKEPPVPPARKDVEQQEQQQQQVEEEDDFDDDVEFSLTYPDMITALERELGRTIYEFQPVSQTRTVLFRVSSTDSDTRFIQATFAESSEYDVAAKLVSIIEFK